MLSLYDRLTSPLFTIVLLGVLLVILRIYQNNFRLSARSLGRPFPPGPPGLPVVENLFDRPDPSQPWLGYRDLCKKYGAMVYLRMMGQSMLVINDAKIAYDLLEKRSAIYSSRPTMIATSLSGWEWVFAFMPYGQWWRRHRRAFWQHFHPAAIAKYRPIQEDGAHSFLVRLLKSPERLTEHIRYALCATLCKVTHGLTVAEENDRNMATFQRALKTVDVLVAGSTLVEVFPFLAKTPTWVPGTGFLRRLAESRKGAVLLRESPWLQAKEAINTGEGPPSITSALLEKISQRLDRESMTEEDIAMSVTGVSYAAGIDTQFAHLHSLFIALSLHPAVQAKAQAELDAVVGPNRLPTFADREALPYVNAVVIELLRWHTATPLGVAHYSMADDEYEGYFIPAETTLLVNVWSILHDPEHYERPNEFMPERYLKHGKLDPDRKDPGAILFGFGRRICPGRYFVDAMLYIFAACVLHTFNVTAALDKDGRPIRPGMPRATAGIVSYLEDRKCTITSRSDRAESLINGCKAAI